MSEDSNFIASLSAILATALLLLGASGMGCASSNSNSTPPGSGGVGGSSSDAAADVAPGGTIPTALANVEGTAEDAFDKALLGDRQAVAADAAQLDTDWKSFRDQASSDGADATSLAAVDAAIAGLVTAAAGTQSPVELARAANAVSAPMPTLYALYHPATPTELLELDYRGREIQLDGQQPDLARAAQDAASLRQTWTALKSAVIANGGSTQAADYDASIAALESDITAGDGAKLATDAVVGLDLVDAMEGLFGK